LASSDNHSRLPVPGRSDLAAPRCEQNQSPMDYLCCCARGRADSWGIDAPETDCEHWSMHTGAEVLDDKTFLSRFEASTFPLEQWHHREHIKTAYLYLRAHRFEVAVERMRTGIRALNAAHGVPDEPTRGYHETMTQAWMRLVQVTLCEYGPEATADEFFELNPQLAEKKVLRFFYSRERMMSPEAKARFVDPDLAPLPRSPKQTTDEHSAAEPETRNPKVEGRVKAETRNPKNLA